MERKILMWLWGILVLLLVLTTLGIGLSHCLKPDAISFPARLCELPADNEPRDPIHAFTGWVKAVPEDMGTRGNYLAVDWGYEPFPDCAQKGRDMKYKTWFPMVLKNSAGKKAIVWPFD